MCVCVAGATLRSHPLAAPATFQRHARDLALDLAAGYFVALNSRKLEASPADRQSNAFAIDQKSTRSAPHYPFTAPKRSATRPASGSSKQRLLRRQEV